MSGLPQGLALRAPLSSVDFQMLKGLVVLPITSSELSRSANSLLSCLVEVSAVLHLNSLADIS